MNRKASPGGRATAKTNNLDTRLFLVLRTRGHHPALELPLRIFSVSGNWGFFWLGLALALWLVGAAGPDLPVKLPAVLYLTLVINYSIKVALRRERPVSNDPRLQPLVGVPSSKSFPSSHAAMSFAAAAVFTLYFPAWWPLFFGLALLMSWSRVYVGVHHPSDVAAGTLVGLILGGLAVLLLQFV